MKALFLRRPSPFLFLGLLAVGWGGVGTVATSRAHLMPHFTDNGNVGVELARPAVWISRLPKTEARGMATTSLPPSGEASPRKVLTGPDRAMLGIGKGGSNVEPNASLRIEYVRTEGSDANGGHSWAASKATIPAAISALPGCTDVIGNSFAHCGHVRVGPGTYGVSSTITYSSPRVEIDGSAVASTEISYTGTGCALSVTTGTGGPPFHANDPQGIVFRNLWIDGSKDANKKICGIYLNASNVVLDHVNVTGFSTAGSRGIWEDISATDTDDHEGYRWNAVWLSNNRIDWQLTNESGIRSPDFGYGKFDIVCSVRAGQTCIQSNGKVWMHYATIKLNVGVSGAGTVFKASGAGLNWNADTIQWHAEQTGGTGCVGIDLTDATSAYWASTGYSDVGWPSMDGCPNKRTTASNYQFSGQATNGPRQFLQNLSYGSDTWGIAAKATRGCDTYQLFDRVAPTSNSKAAYIMFCPDNLATALFLSSGTGVTSEISPSALLSSQVYKLPAKGGTFALTSHLPLKGSVSGSTRALAPDSCGDPMRVIVNGATTSMVAVASPQGSVSNGLSWNSYVSSADTVTVTYCNPTSETIVPKGVTFSVRVIQ